MNKTVTINVSGIIFHIEENAYETLSKYLTTIKGYFSKTDGGNEIMSDIESRVAELLQQKINPGKQVILLADVDYVIQVMGRPEDFGADESRTNHGEQTTQQTFTSDEQKIKKRLFRDPDDRAIGGVCSGLSAYFDIDVVWVRLAMFLLIFFGGVSLWVYLVLWIVIPEARSVADRLAMRGESANINNIMKNFKEEAEDIKNRANKYGKEFRSRNYGEAVRNNASVVLNTIFGIIGRIIGFMILCMGIVLFFFYIASITGLSILDSDNTLSHWKAVIFESRADYLLGVVCFVIVLGLPIFMLIYAGIKLLFKVRYSNRWLNLSLGLIWVVGFIIGIYIVATTLRHFSQRSRLKQNYELHGVGDTLVIKMNPAINLLKTVDCDNQDEAESYFSRNHSGYFFPEYNTKLGVMGYAGLNILESNSDSIEMTIINSANGAYKKDANENAREIKYSFNRQKNTLIFDEVFFVPPGNKFRKQEVDIKIKLPKGKVVYFDKSIKYMLDDVDNVTNTWDGEMAGRRWKMTEKGLECIDCEGLEKGSHLNDDDDVEDNDQKVVINGEGIKVNGEDAQIKIDNDGIKIKTPTREWNITDEEKKKNKKEEKK